MLLFFSFVCFSCLLNISLCVFVLFCFNQYCLTRKICLIQIMPLIVYFEEIQEFHHTVKKYKVFDHLLSYFFFEMLAKLEYILRSLMMEVKSHLFNYLHLYYYYVFCFVQTLQTKYKIDAFDHVPHINLMIAFFTGDFVTCLD